MFVCILIPVPTWYGYTPNWNPIALHGVREYPELYVDSLEIQELYVHFLEIQRF